MHVDLSTSFAAASSPIAAAFGSPTTSAMWSQAPPPPPTFSSHPLAIPEVMMYPSAHIGAICVACSAPCADATVPCTRRCQWFASGGCPQCGRWRDLASGATFCGAPCAIQAHQANWCVSCGVRQALHGRGSCGFAVCEVTAPQLVASLLAARHQQTAALKHQHQQQSLQYHPYQGQVGEMSSSFGGGAASTPFVPSSFAAAYLPHRQSIRVPRAAAATVGNGGALSARHGRGAPSHHHAAVPLAPSLFEVLPSQDKHRNAIAVQLSSVARVLAVLKLNVDAATRKRYLAYRTRVEGEIAGFGETKYGFGGEGNEQRRYTPLHIACQRAVTLQEGGAFVRCGASDCDGCRIMTQGVKLSTMSVGSHYSITHHEAAASFCPRVDVGTGGDASSSAVCAMLVTRVVLGRPCLLASSADVTCTLPAGCHSFVVSNGAPAQDGAYVLEDDAVDPQYLVYFAPFA